MGELLPYSIWYQNSAGEIIRFDEAPILVQSGTALFDYRWSMTAFDRALRDGGRAVHARRAIQERTLLLDVFADTQKAHNAALNRLHDVLDYDVCALRPGRLWVNDRYIRCYAVASSKTMDRDWTTYTVVNLTLKVISPAWTAEECVTLLPVSDASAGTAEKRYAGKYPYRYPEGRNVSRFVNEAASAAPMIIKICGACASPSVYVGGQEYSVNGDIAAGEYVVIDQRDKSIVKVGANGSRVNWFGRRKKSVDNFAYAPPGNLEIACSGLFAVEITFLTQRSEPEALAD